MRFFGVISVDRVPGVKVSFGDSRQYTIVPYSAENHLAKFRAGQKAQLLMNSFPVMRSLAQWEIYANLATGLFKHYNIPGAADVGYSMLWYIRSDFIVEMRSADVPRLEVDKDIIATRWLARRCLN